MFIKKVYNENGDVDYISLAHTGATPNQNFSVKIITEMMEAGFAEIVGNELILHVYPEDLHYEIKREPGHWCLHCGEKLTSDPKGAMARLHIAQRHAGIPSPSASDPSGYVALNEFQCVLNPKQHEKFKVKNPARAPHFPLKEK